MTCDHRTSYFNLITEPRTLRRMFENSGHGWNLREQLAGSSSRSGRNRGAAVEADAIGEQQTKRTPSGSRLLKQMQSGSCSRSGRTREAVDNREQQLKADASSKKQLKRMQAGSSAAVETDRCNHARSSS